MNIANALAQEHSKENTEKIAQYAVSSDESLAELMSIFLNGEWQEVQKAAWVVGHLAKTDQLLPYLSAMIHKLHEKNYHNAVKRNIIRTWQFMDIPENKMGEVADLCFSYLNDHSEAIAVKVFSMVVLEKIVKEYPVLKEELRFSIEEQMPFASAGFKSRGRKVLASLKKL